MAVVRHGAGDVTHGGSGCRGRVVSASRLAKKKPRAIGRGFSALYARLLSEPARPVAEPGVVPQRTRRPIVGVAPAHRGVGAADRRVTGVGLAVEAGVCLVVAAEAALPPQLVLAQPPVIPIVGRRTRSGGGDAAGATLVAAPVAAYPRPFAAVAAIAPRPAATEPLRPDGTAVVVPPGLRIPFRPPVATAAIVTPIVRHRSSLVRFALRLFRCAGGRVHDRNVRSSGR